MGVAGRNPTVPRYVDSGAGTERERDGSSGDVCHHDRLVHVCVFIIVGARAAVGERLRRDTRPLFCQLHDKVANT